MKHYLPVIAAMLLSVALPQLSLQAQEEEALKLDKSRPAELLNFDYPTSTLIRQVMSVDQNVNVGGLEQDLTMDIEVSMKVFPPVNGNKKIETTYERVASFMSFDGQPPQGVDSADPNSPPGPLHALTGKPFYLIVDSSNKVIAVEGLQALVNAAGGGDPVLTQNLQQMVNEQQLSQMMNLWIEEGFVNRPVKAGDSWPTEVKMPMALGEVSFKGDYFHRGHANYQGHDCMVLDVEGEMSLDLSNADPGNAQAQMLKQMDVKLENGSQKVRIFWDNKLGNIRGMVTKQKMTTTMINPQDGNRMRMPTVQDIVIEVGYQKFE